MPGGSADGEEQVLDLFSLLPPVLCRPPRWPQVLCLSLRQPPHQPEEQYDKEQHDMQKDEDDDRDSAEGDSGNDGDATADGNANQ